MNEDYDLNAETKAAISGVISKRTIRALERGEWVIVCSENLNRIVSNALKNESERSIS